ncbi:MAG TPA: OB-fold domain-containing protein [Acidimicrobiales bacterium]|nr:OB-fold domain-containing protein [Acidimicrobiales bacterium]
MSERAEVTDEELVRLFPGHALSHDNKAAYRGRLERVLLVNRCRACGSWHEPPKPLCPVCWSTDVVPTPVAGTGTIFMAIFLHQGPPAEGVDYATPYPVVTVELDEQEGLRVTSTVVGAANEDVRIGRRVRLDWAERGGVPMPVFRLAEGE